MTARGVLVELFECLGGLKHLKMLDLGETNRGSYSWRVKEMEP